MSLEIVIGPMYSGKTTSLISAYQAIADVNKIRQFAELPKTARL